MAQRSAQKERSHRRIVAAAARLLREHGVAATGVDRVMAAAGLTHGGFYAHFRDKSALIVEALTLAQRQTRDQWVSGLDAVAPAARPASIAARYLNAAHRDDVAGGCPLPAVSGEIPRHDEDVRRVYGDEAARTIEALAAAMPGPDPDRGPDHSGDRAIGTLATCVGGLMLARAVSDPVFSDRILRACRGFILRALSRDRREA